MKKDFISKQLIAFSIIATFFSFILMHNVEATSVEETNSKNVPVEKEEVILEYDAITGETREVNMEELQKVISLYNNNSENVNKVEGYTPKHRQNQFNSLIMPMMSDSRYETTATRITNTAPAPYSKVLKTVSDGGESTAFLVGPRAAMTSAHCIFTKNGNEFFKNWHCYAGFNGTKYFGPSSGWTKVYYSNTWMDSHESSSDWAIVVLGEDYSQEVGWFGTQMLSDSELSNLNVTTLGYPTDAHYGYDGGSQYMTGYKVKKVATNDFTYGAFTTDGYSGSPIMRDSDNYVVGVHYGSLSHTLSGGVRVNQAMINVILDLNK